MLEAATLVTGRNHMERWEKWGGAGVLVYCVGVGIIWVYSHSIFQLAEIRYLLFPE
jgi:hypothetical protein